MPMIPWSLWFPDYDERMQVMADYILGHLMLWDEHPELMPKLA